MKTLLKSTYGLLSLVCLAILIYGGLSYANQPLESNSQSRDTINNGLFQNHPSIISEEFLPSPLTDESLNYLFEFSGMGQDQSNTLNLSYLNEKQMLEAEGKFGLPGAIVGAIGAGAGYYGQAIGSGEGSASGLVTAVGVGAGTGFLLGPAGNTTAWSFLTGMVGFNAGLAGGLGQRGCNSCH
ncbi:hypothetical protein [Nitrincola sp.]|uniref:hypothetical protein n=1 Tax=Nitrincola sp. TaxID=1926584 RepID=UPI003A91F372